MPAPSRVQGVVVLHVLEVVDIRVVLEAAVLQDVLDGLDVLHILAVEDHIQVVEDHIQVVERHSQVEEVRSQVVEHQPQEAAHSQEAARHILEAGSHVADGLVAVRTQEADAHILVAALHILVAALHSLDVRVVADTHAVVEAQDEVPVEEVPAVAVQGHTHEAPRGVYCYHHGQEAARSLQPEVAHTPAGVVERGADYNPVVVDNKHLAAVEVVAGQPHQEMDFALSSDSVSLKALEAEDGSPAQVAPLGARVQVLEAARDAQAEHLGAEADDLQVAAPVGGSLC